MVTTTLSHVGAVAASANLKENFPAALALTILFLLLAAAVFIGGPALWRKLH